MIETERLRLLPLTHQQLQLYILADGSLEASLNLSTTQRTISPALKEALEETILPNVADPGKNYLYATLWTVIFKAENKMVGDLCFVGEPNEEGKVEIGYGTYENFWGMGFMTEAVGGMIDWAKKQLNVKSILASTDKNNPASFAVLQKNKFEKSGENDQLFHWKIDINP